jgi:hypothetical protein
MSCGKVSFTTTITLQADTLFQQSQKRYINLAPVKQRIDLKSKASGIACICTVGSSDSRILLDKEESCQ